MRRTAIRYHYTTVDSFLLTKPCITIITTSYQEERMFMAVLSPRSCVVMLVFALFISGCKWDGNGSPPEKFDYDLQGTWTATERPLAKGETAGKLVIGYDTITITGSVLPFNAGYTKGIELKGYSEAAESDRDTTRGTLFVKDKGEVKNVPYMLWSAAKEDILTLGTAPNDETFQQVR
jgi:hypothetical protein